MEIKLKTNEVLVENRFVYSFIHKTKIKHFGPYESLEEAKTAFQSRYGYWPEDPVNTDGYVNDPRSRRG